MNIADSSSFRPDPFVLKSSDSPAIDALFSSPAYSRSDIESKKAEERLSNQLFVDAMAESYSYHLAHCKEYCMLANADKNMPAVIESLSDVERIPWVFVQSFKERELLSIHRQEVQIALTSSGTSGVLTKTFLDSTSLNRLQVAGYQVCRDMGVVGPEAPVSNYMMFTYDIEDAPQLGTAWTTNYLSEMVPASSRKFLIRQRASRDGMEFDIEDALSIYLNFVESGLPLRILGFPAFIYHTFFEATQRRLPTLSNAAAEKSWVLTGGGWKSHKGESIGKRAFAKLVGAATHIPINQVRDLFGMAEHGIGYADCEYGNLHVPRYAHAVTRDPMTLEIQGYDSPGILQLFTPLLKSSPALSLLTTDEVILRSESCLCGRSGVRLEYLGRLGLKKHDGCAIRSLDYLTI